MTSEKLNDIMSNWTQLIFPVLTHGILLFGLVTTFIVIQRSIWEQGGFERLARAFAFFTAPLAILSARAFDVSLPEMLLRVLSVSNPVLTATAGVLIPGGAGVLAAWFFIRVINRGDRDSATRIMILIGTFLLFMFGDVYVAAVATEGAVVNKYLAPNIAFMLALFVYVTLNYKDVSRESVKNVAVGN